MTGDAGSAADPAAGGSLEALQAWFGRALGRPLPEAYSGNPLAAGAPELRAEGDALLRGGAGLSGFDRLGLYNQQYWFRLIGILQGEYPCALHVLGLRPFNAWAVRFLSAHPPSSPYLARLDDGWAAFLEREYRGPERELLLEAVAVDGAFSRAVDAPGGDPLPREAAALAAAPVRMAPHASVLALGWDFPAYRALCLADESLEQSLSPAPGRCDLLVWRGADGVLWQKRVSAAARKALSALRAPVRLEDAFARLEAELAPGENEELAANLASWFEEWAREGILVR